MNENEKKKQKQDLDKHFRPNGLLGILFTVKIFFVGLFKKYYKLGLFFIILGVVLTSVYVAGNNIYKRFSEPQKKTTIVVTKHEVDKSEPIRDYNFKVTKDIQITSDFIKWKTNNRIPTIMADYIAYTIHKYAPKFGYDVSFVVAKVYAESAFDPRLISNVGAKGLLQVLSKGVGCSKETKQCQIEFDMSRLHEVDYGIWAGLQVFRDKMDQVKSNLKKNKYNKNNRNILVDAMTRYVGASSKKGRAIAREYTNKILRVQGEYVLFRSTYNEVDISCEDCPDNKKE